jgi:hypothetical protein
MKRLIPPGAAPTSITFQVGCNGILNLSSPSMILKLALETLAFEVSHEVHNRTSTCDLVIIFLVEQTFGSD